MIILKEAGKSTGTACKENSNVLDVFIQITNTASLLPGFRSLLFPCLESTPKTALVYI